MLSRAPSASFTGTSASSCWMTSPKNTSRTGRRKKTPKPAKPYSLPPTVVRDEDGQRAVRRMRWGLLPNWGMSDQEPVQPFNAKAETLEEKSWFSVPLKSRRCLVPASGFLRCRPAAKSGCGSQSRSKNSFRLRGCGTASTMSFRHKRSSRLPRASGSASSTIGRPSSCGPMTTTVGLIRERRLPTRKLYCTRGQVL